MSKNSSRSIGYENVFPCNATTSLTNASLFTQTAAFLNDIPTIATPDTETTNELLLDILLTVPKP